MSDLEQDLRTELTRQAEGVQALPRDVWLRIVEGSGAGLPTWMKLAPVAVAMVFIAATGFVLTQPRRGSPPSRAPVAATSATPGHAATALPAQSPTASVDAFACSATLSGGTSSAGGGLTAIRVAHQPGFDRVTFEFGGSGIPVYTATQQAGTHFAQDGSGKSIDLQGVGALRMVFKGASGAGSYSGSTDIKLPPGGVPDKSSIVEVRETGDFERVLSWGIGLNVKPGCVRILQLGAPARLVVDVQDNP